MSLLVLNANIGTVLKKTVILSCNTRKCTKCAKVCQFSSLALRPSMHPLNVLAVAFTKPDMIDSLDSLCLSLTFPLFTILMLKLALPP